MTRTTTTAVSPPRSFDLSGIDRLEHAWTTARQRAAHASNAPSERARQAYQAWSNATSDARRNVREAAEKVTALEHQPMYDQDKAALRSTLLETYGEEVNGARNLARAAAAEYRDALEAAALPTPPRKSEAEAAERRALLILDRVEAEKRDEAFMALAKRGDEVAGLVTGDWGRDYLAATDPARAETLHQQARGEAIGQAAASGDQQRIAAAQALSSAGTLTGLADTIGSLWEEAADSLRTPSGERAAAQAPERTQQATQPQAQPAAE